MIDVWIVEFSAFSAEAGVSRTPLNLDGLPAGLLTGEEVRRARSFPAGIEGRRYAASRIFLRSVLAGYAGRPAGELDFLLGPGGKPVLSLGPSDLHFNLSHSGDAALLAVADTDVGVDIERHRTIRELGSLVEYAFTPEEVRVFSGLPGGAREEVFFRAWCLKEAVIKAWGERAAVYLDRIGVVGSGTGNGSGGEGPGGSVRFEDAFTREGVVYRAFPLHILPGYFSAACLRCGEIPYVRIRRYHWPPGTG